MPSSITLFEGLRPKVCDIELDHDDVSSVVVLLRVRRHIDCGEIEGHIQFRKHAITSGARPTDNGQQHPGGVRFCA